MNKNFVRKNKDAEHRINRHINQWGKVNEVRLVGENIESRIYTLDDALQMAEEAGEDLVEINSTVVPPICKIEDYNKFIYQQDKLERERKKNAPKNEIKEIQLSVNIGENDFSTMLKRAIGFLKEGAKIKCVLSMKGRQKARPELGEITILKFITELDEFGTPEAFPKMENWRWLTIIKPKKK